MEQFYSKSITNSNLLLECYTIDILVKLGSKLAVNFLRARQARVRSLRVYSSGPNKYHF